MLFCAHKYVIIIIIIIIIKQTYLNMKTQSATLFELTSVYFVFPYRGLLCKSIIAAQTASPTFTHVYASLVAVINTKVST